MLHTRLDTIMFGCLIALLYDNPAFNRFIDDWVGPIPATAGAIVFVLISPFAQAWFEAKYLWTIGYTLNAICVSIVLIYAVRNPASLLGRLLNFRVMRHIGVISYGLYLWQQLFTGPRASWFPLDLLMILLCAELSFTLIEQPAFLLRDLIERRLWPKRVLVVAG